MAISTWENGATLAEIITADIWGVATPEEIAYLREHLTLAQWLAEVSQLYKITALECRQLIAQKQRIRAHFLAIDTAASKEAYLRAREQIEQKLNRRQDFIVLCQSKQQQINSERGEAEQAPALPDYSPRISRLPMSSGRMRHEADVAAAAERKTEKRAAADERRYQQRSGYDSGFYAAMHSMHALIEHRGMSAAEALEMCCEQHEHIREWRNRNSAEESVPWLPDFPRISAKRVVDDE